jgi:glucan 1,3-beta-glucosidase
MVKFFLVSIFVILSSEILENHWDQWVTEDHFKTLSSNGINFLRIPLGYWAMDILDSEPFVGGQFKYLNRILGWAERYDLQILIDLHGAPGF